MDRTTLLKKGLAVFFALAFIALLSSNVFFYLNGNRLDKMLSENAAEIKTLQGKLDDVLADNEALQAEIDELSVPAAAVIPPETLAYQGLYPDMSVDFPGFAADPDKKTVYLTFDDGPSENTMSILDTLDQYGIKAMFFVVCKDNARSKDILKEIAKRGHNIGVHSYTHMYKKIYASVDAYLDDFYKEFSLIYKITGVKPTVFRFPGGSVNAYNYTIYQSIIAEMLRRGFVYYDWNVSSKDAGGEVMDAKKITAEVISQTVGKKKAIVLFHDSDDKKATAEALPDIIERLTDKGYQFEKLDNTLLPIVFSYKD